MRSNHELMFGMGISIFNFKYLIAQHFKILPVILAFFYKLLEQAVFLTFPLQIVGALLLSLLLFVLKY